MKTKFIHNFLFLSSRRLFFNEGVAKIHFSASPRDDTNSTYMYKKICNFKKLEIEEAMTLEFE